MSWMVRGRVQLRPPSVDLTIWSFPCGGRNVKGDWNSSQKTYTSPTLSVRIVHPDRPHLLGATFVAGLTCFCSQVAPPSEDLATLTGAAPLPVKFAQHT